MKEAGQLEQKRAKKPSLTVKQAVGRVGRNY